MVSSRIGHVKEPWYWIKWNQSQGFGSPGFFRLHSPPLQLLKWNSHPKSQELQNPKTNTNTDTYPCLSYHNSCHRGRVKQALYSKISSKRRSSVKIVFNMKAFRSSALVNLFVLMSTVETCSSAFHSGMIRIQGKRHDPRLPSTIDGFGRFAEEIAQNYRSTQTVRHEATMCCCRDCFELYSVIPIWPLPFNIQKLHYASPSIREVVQGSSLRVFPFSPSRNSRSLRIDMMTDGRPLEARAELWHGPSYCPQKIRVYSENGYERRKCCWNEYLSCCRLPNWLSDSLFLLFHIQRFAHALKHHHWIPTLQLPLRILGKPLNFHFPPRFRTWRQWTNPMPIPFIIPN